MNDFKLLGNLTANPELTTVGDTVKCSISIAWNNPYIKEKDSPKRVSFFNGELWGKQAEIFAKYHNKGDRVLVSGQMIQDRWEDKEGQKRSAVKLRISEFSFVKTSDGSKVAEDGTKAVEGDAAPDTIPPDEALPF